MYFGHTYAPAVCECEYYISDFIVHPFCNSWLFLMQWKGLLTDERERERAKCI